MRVVVLCSSVYSETACAMAARLAGMGYVPDGALCLRTLDRKTVLRKLQQWGMRDVARYARTKLIAQPSGAQPQLRNPELRTLLNLGDRTFRSLRDVASFYRFPVVVCNNQNDPNAISQLRDWAPDLILFTGGNILRKELLAVPRLGVLNVHLGMLPEIRGMSSPEWSLLKGTSVGITIHYMDEGIDSGPVLQRYEYPDAFGCESLADLRNQLIAFGVEKAGEVIEGLDHGTIGPSPQSDLDKDNQFFVMHEWLQACAAEMLARSCTAPVARTVNG